MKVHIQRAENILMGYSRKDWHLIPPTDQEYVKAAKVFADHQASIGRPIESIQFELIEGKPNVSLHESWCNAVTGVTTQCIWAAKEILSNSVH